MYNNKINTFLSFFLSFFVFIYLFAAWQKLSKKEKRATKKWNFYKIRKAKRALRRMIGVRKWRKLPRVLKGILIQLKLCKKKMKKFKRMFKRIWKLYFKGANGKRIGRVLKKSKWGKKNPKAAGKMARCLKNIKNRKPKSK